jgi:hypothetical protein
VIIFLWHVGPTWQSHTSNTNSLNLAYPLDLIRLEQGLSINPTRKTLDKGQRYKSHATSCSFEVDDPQEIQERERDLLRHHPSDYSLLTGGSHTSVIKFKKKEKKQTLRTNPKNWSGTIPIQ